MDSDYEEVNCAICKSCDSEKICDTGQFGLPAYVVICKDCGLSYLNPRWTKERYTKFYEHEYDGYYRPQVKSKNDDTGMNVYEPVHNRLVSSGLLPIKIDRVLDIGSGDGSYLSYLMERLGDAEYFAIEPSKQCRKSLVERGVEILGTDVDSEYPKFEGSFDLIVLRHVLEHMQDPVEAAKKVRSLLSDSGVAYFAIPNSMKFGDLPLAGYWFRVVHTYYFGPCSLKNVFKRAGLELISLTEGDQYNEKELFAMVRRGEEVAADIDASTYLRQRELFHEGIKRDSAPVSIVRRFWRRFRKSYARLRQSSS